MRVEDLYDWEKATSRLAAQAPWWEPGTASGYHAITQGYLVGEVVRRVTGVSARRRSSPRRSPGRSAPTSTSAPAPSTTTASRRVIPPPPAGDATAAPTPTSIAVRTLANPPLDADAVLDEAWRRAEIPAAGGHGNARSVARGAVGAGLRRRGRTACGCCPRPAATRLRASRPTAPTSSSACPLRLGIGYGLSAPEIPIGPNPRTCFWGGWGGSLVVNDLDARLTIAYVMNRMGEGTVGDDRGAGIVLAAYTALDA